MVDDAGRLREGAARQWRWKLLIRTPISSVKRTAPGSRSAAETGKART